MPSKESKARGGKCGGDKSAVNVLPAKRAAKGGEGARRTRGGHCDHLWDVCTGVVYQSGREKGKTTRLTMCAVGNVRKRGGRGEARDVNFAKVYGEELGVRNTTPVSENESRFGTSILGGRG